MHFCKEPKTRKSCPRICSRSLGVGIAGAFFISSSCLSALSTFPVMPTSAPSPSTAGSCPQPLARATPAHHFGLAHRGCSPQGRGLSPECAALRPCLAGPLHCPCLGPTDTAPLTLQKQLAKSGSSVTWAWPCPTNHFGVQSSMSLSP